jgi:queuine/archaeosine tRNA-ribosyltransferase
VSIEFHIDATRGAGRAGKLITPHGAVETPVFMPVGTLASVKGVPQDLLEELGVQILLGNTYHLYLRPGVENVRRMGGLHGFMAWDRAILTDSGGFQVFSLNELRKVNEEGVTFRSHLDGSSHFFSPESSMAAQIGLGADIIMAFDECTEFPAERERVRASMEMTLRWAERSKRYFEEHRAEVPWGSTQHPALSIQPAESVAGEAQLAGETPAAPAPRVERAGGVEAHAGRSARATQAAELRSAGRVGAPAPTWVGTGAASGDQPEATPTWAGARSGPGTAQAEGTAAGATQALFGIVQGGMELDLRRESVLRTIEIGFPGYAIGGLSVGEPRERTREVVAATVEHLPADKPRYLMGVGTPEEIAEYARMGIDMMDCVLPTRAARHGLLFTSQGKVSIKQARYITDEGPLDPKCGCRVCRRYSRAYLRHLYASNEVLAQVLNTVHNLSFYLDTMRAVRHSIRLGEENRLLSGVSSQPNP